MTFNTNQVREHIKERVQYISEGIQKFNHRNKIKHCNSKKVDQNMQRKTTTVENKRDSMQQTTSQPRDKYKQKDNKK